MVTPLVRVKSVKKKTNKFKRHQSDRKMAVKVRDGLWPASAAGGGGGGKPGGRRSRLSYPRVCARRRAGAAPRVLTPACAGSSRAAASSCPTLGTAPTRRPATRCPTVRAPAMMRWGRVAAGACMAALHERGRHAGSRGASSQEAVLATCGAAGWRAAGAGRAAAAQWQRCVMAPRLVVANALGSQAAQNSSKMRAARSG